MARLVSGAVVVLPFPFSDFSSVKVRPGFVLAWLPRGDLILCQITSQSAGHPEAIPVQLADFEPGGGLPHDSFALPHRIVTANESCVRRVSGKLQPRKLHEIRERVCAAIREA